MKKLMIIFAVLLLLSGCRKWDVVRTYELLSLTNHMAYSARGSWSLFAGTLSLAEGDFFLIYTKDESGAIQMKRLHAAQVRLYQYTYDKKPSAVLTEHFNSASSSKYPRRVQWELYIPEGTIAPIFDVQQGWRE
jgi:hypothetical protein